MNRSTSAFRLVDIVEDSQTHRAASVTYSLLFVAARASCSCMLQSVLRIGKQWNDGFKASPARPEDHVEDGSGWTMLKGM
jgi:hypothetical protein